MMVGTRFVTLFNFALLNTLSYAKAVPLRDDNLRGFDPRQLTPTSNHARLTKLKRSSHPDAPASSPYSTSIRPTNQNSQRVIEVSFNNIPRYLLLDTGSSDTWMISPDFQCLNVSFLPVPTAQCNFGDPYTGPDIRQIRNETYAQEYGTGESMTGPFGYADVAIAGLHIKSQKVALVNRGYLIGDHVRSGVVGVAPRAVGALYQNTNATNTPPNGTVTTPYSPVFESMYSQGQVSPFFSLALERGDTGGYIAFGGLPPVNFSQDFSFTPFKGVNYFGYYEPDRFYPIQPEGFELNGAKQSTDYRVVVDSGTDVNRLPQDIAEKVNAAYNPPGVYNEEYQLYQVPCNATAPSFSFNIAGTVFAMDPKDMFFPLGENICATSFTRGFDFGAVAYPKGFYVLGDVFLNNVVAVFDVGGGGMWFTKHSY